MHCKLASDLEIVETQDALEDGHIVAKACAHTWESLLMNVTVMHGPPRFALAENLSALAENPLSAGRPTPHMSLSSHMFFRCLQCLSLFNVEMLELLAFLRVLNQLCLEFVWHLWQ